MAKAKKRSVTVKVTIHEDVMPGLAEKLLDMPSGMRGDYFRRVSWTGFQLEEKGFALISIATQGAIDPTPASASALRTSRTLNSKEVDNPVRGRMQTLAAIGIDQ
jgi:hypothetical protein